MLTVCYLVVVSREDELMRVEGLEDILLECFCGAS